MIGEGRLPCVFFITISLSALGNAEPTVENHHKLLLLSIDALRWDYFDHIKDMPGFKYLRENGIRAEYVKPAFPSHTSPTHTTMATGLYSESHGIVHNCFYDLEKNTTGQTDFHGGLAINDWWDNGQEPIWITASSQGLKSGGYLYPGSNATIGGRSATRSILQKKTTKFDEKIWQKRIDDVMKWFTEDDFDFVALYFEQPDAFGHKFGPDSDEVLKMILPAIDRTLQHLFKQVQNYGLTENLNMIIASDHGMTNIKLDIPDDEVIVISKYIEPSWVTFQFGYGPLGLVEPVTEHKTNVYEALKAANTHMDVYYKEDIPERFHYKNNPRVPSIFILAHPGHRVYDKFPESHAYKGDHGYDNDLEKMRASYYSIGPSFKKGITVEGFESVNIYPLMCHLLGLEPAPNNGSLDVLFTTLREIENESENEQTMYFILSTTSFGLVLTFFVRQMS
ncbi:ectonucleotide pyrophosphatase/phosphodiesterase family member 7-like [Styela clava]